MNRAALKCSSGCAALAAALSIGASGCAERAAFAEHETGERLFAAAPGSPIALAGGASNVELADLDRDGDLDLIVAASKAPAVAILLGDGKGSFAPWASLECAQAPGELCVGDVDEDGHLDLAVASHDSHAVTLFFGDGRGGFARHEGPPPVVGSSGKPHNHGLVFGDIDGDSHLDLAASNSEDDTVAVLLGDGKGGFTRGPGSPHAAGPAPYPLALGDLDGDGRLDCAVPDSGTGAYYREHHELASSVTLLCGDGRGGFAPMASSPLRVLPGPYYVALGDLDGDQHLDLVTAHDDSASISILLNDGAGRFRPAPQSPLDVGRRAWKLLVVDADGDGARDLLLATGNGVTVLLGDGHGRFARAPGSPFAAGRWAWRVAAGDLDRDGKLDVVTSDSESGGISILLGR